MSFRAEKLILQKKKYRNQWQKAKGRKKHLFDKTHEDFKLEMLRRQEGNKRSRKTVKPDGS